MDSTESYRDRSQRVWPGLWIPLAILLAGVIATGLTASLEARRAQALADTRYQAHHQALVNHLLIHAWGLPAGAIASDADTTAWLQSLFSDTVPSFLGLRIDTLERHTKSPLLEIQVGAELDPSRALRTEISPGEQHWMLTTVPLPSPLERAARQSQRTIWVAGLAMTLIAVLLTLTLCRRLHHQRTQLNTAAHQATGADHQIINLQVEKAILRQALNDSEQRSRDLVALSGSIVCELDETGTIGFMSPQIAELIDHAPSDLTGRPFEDLIAASYRDNYRLTLTAARKEGRIERIDLPLQHRDNEHEVAVVLRVRALKDPVHGLAGFRLSAQPLPGMPYR